MKFFLFKVLLRVAIRFAPNKEVARFLRQRIICAQREKEMNDCIRPRTNVTYEDDNMEQ